MRQYAARAAGRGGRGGGGARPARAPGAWRWPSGPSRRCGGAGPAGLAGAAGGRARQPAGGAGLVPGRATRRPGCGWPAACGRSGSCAALLREGRRWLERAAGARARADARRRAKALLGAGLLAREQGDLAAARGPARGGPGPEPGARRSRALVAWALRELGDVLRRPRRPARGRARCSRRGWPSAGRSATGAAWASTLIVLGRVAKRGGDYRRARALLEEALALARRGRRPLADRRRPGLAGAAWPWARATTSGRAALLGGGAGASREELGVAWTVVRAALAAGRRRPLARATWSGPRRCTRRAWPWPAQRRTRSAWPGIWPAWGGWPSCRATRRGRRRCWRRAWRCSPRMGDQAGVGDGAARPGAGGLAPGRRGAGDGAAAGEPGGCGGRWATGWASPSAWRGWRRWRPGPAGPSGRRGCWGRPRRCARRSARRCRRSSGPATRRRCAAARAALGEAAFAAAWAAGRALTLDEAVAEALARGARAGDRRPRRRPAPSRRPADGLTPREVEVLRLVAAGRSNRADRRRAGAERAHRRAPHHQPLRQDRRRATGPRPPPSPSAAAWPRPARRRRRRHLTDRR